MARRRGHDEQVDPFTAGEPTLPWDEVGTFEGFADDVTVEECPLDDGPYDGPTKAPDAYRAPEPQNEGVGSPDHPDEDRTRKAGERAERRAERRARKAAPQDQGTGRRPFGVLRAIFIFFILVNVLPLVMDAVGQAVAAISQNDSPDPGAPHDETVNPSLDENGVEPEIDRSLLDEDELACVATVDAHLQAIAGEQGRERAAMIDALDRYLSDYVGYSCEELGIDATAYADWVLSNFSYRITSCYTRPDEGTASVYLYTWCPDTIDIVPSAGQPIYSYLNELGLGDRQQRRDLTEGERDEVRRLFTEAVENAEVESEAFLGFDLTLRDGSWVLDLEQTRYQLGIALGY